MKKTVYRAKPENTRARLDTFISEISNHTRSHVQKLLSRKLVLVNSRAEKAGYKVKPGDMIEVVISEDPEGLLEPEDIPLDILWEDDHIMVINKPPGMVIYPAAGNRLGTMMNAVAARGTKLSAIGAPLRPGVVHRLDKDTSGTIVLAKDNMAYYDLVRQFKKRETEKHYLALLYGRLKMSRGEINAEIGRSLSDRKKMSTRTKRGKEAITHFEVMELFQSATLAKIRILTGRTHQIRVHFASLGHPVLGDKTYGKKTSLVIDKKTIHFSRQMLHAHSLKLRHPSSGKVMEFTSPIAEDMEKAIKKIRQEGPLQKKY